MAADFATLDHARHARCGHPEAVYAAGKTPDEVTAICAAMVHQNGSALITRMQADHAEALARTCAKVAIRWCSRRRTALVGTPPALRSLAKPVRIVCAGTSDLPVAQEAQLTLLALGIEADMVVDVGVAGIHRLLDRADHLRSSGALIVCAGMEGALPSVVGGLVACPVVAVPTSVGYGVSAGGQAALHGMLGSCAAGIVVVNIDNGFGAACAVGRMLNGA